MNSKNQQDNSILMNSKNQKDKSATMNSKNQQDKSTIQQHHLISDVKHKSLLGKTYDTNFYFKINSTKGNKKIIKENVKSIYADLDKIKMSIDKIVDPLEKIKIIDYISNNWLIIKNNDNDMSADYQYIDLSAIFWSQITSYINDDQLDYITRMEINLYNMFRCDYYIIVQKLNESRPLFKMHMLDSEVHNKIDCFYKCSIIANKIPFSEKYYVTKNISEKYYTTKNDLISKMIQHELLDYLMEHHRQFKIIKIMDSGYYNLLTNSIEIHTEYLTLIYVINSPDLKSNSIIIVNPKDKFAISTSSFIILFYLAETQSALI